MSEESNFAVSTRLDRSQLERFELGRVQWLRRFGDGGRDNIGAGYWVVSPDEAPEPFDLVGEADETIHIVEGRITIEVEGGVTHDLTPGMSASLNRGTATRWTIHEPVVEFFVYS
ncbi:hypothetical protein GCM10027416_12870 [Okibacterium endophyticum]